MAADEQDDTRIYEEALTGQPGEGNYVLRLYVAGMTSRSTEALASIKAICEERLPGRYDLQVIDIYKHPATVKQDQIVAMPTLIKKQPSPLRRMIGDLSDKSRVLKGLDLPQDFAIRRG